MRNRCCVTMASNMHRIDQVSRDLDPLFFTSIPTHPIGISCKDKTRVAESVRDLGGTKTQHLYAGVPYEPVAPLRA